jgi:phage-related protein
MDKETRKPVRWIGSSYDDWKSFPDEVQDTMGYALDLAQQGKKATDVKPLKGFIGASVLEIVDDFDSNTYRAIYTVQFKEVIYVLHAFQKKSKKGIAMPKPDGRLIRQHLKDAREHYETYQT